MLLVPLPASTGTCKLIGIAFQHVDYHPIVLIGHEEVELSTTRKRTYCILYDVKGEDAEQVAVGVSSCSHRDNFCKETGRQIALKDALKDLRITAGMDNETWKTIMAGYTNRPRPVSTPPVTSLMKVEVGTDLTHSGETIH